ncbi:MAG: sulfite exporter TauE/SafE family protein [Mariprofundales bacterium]
MAVSLPSTLLLMLSMGVMGSLHCIGMCGGLVGVLSMSRPRVWWRGLMLYQCGRVTTYGVFGLLAGIGGVALATVGGVQLQSLLALLAGGVMIMFALNLAGWLPDPLLHISGWVRKTSGLARLAQRVSHSGGGWYVLGLVNGLLPCGLVYAALSLALAAGSAIDAALMMVTFGLGTIPAMMLAPSLMRRLTPSLRTKALRIAALLIFGMGCVTIYRSVMPWFQMDGGLHG